MARQTSKGICQFCQGEFSKATMTKHLTSCPNRAASAAAETGSRKPGRKTKTFHLVVQGRDLPKYWMHLQATGSTTLVDLDQFLRDTWLECCGHLSSFEIAGQSYASDAEMESGWGTGDKSMRIRLDKVLSPGLTFLHEYDFGTTTELSLKVVSEEEREAKGKAIQLLARNTPPEIPCQVCGKPATEICSECVFDDEGCHRAATLALEPLRVGDRRSQPDREIVGEVLAADR